MRRFSRSVSSSASSASIASSAVDLAALDAAQRDVEDLERPRHLQADQGLLDAVDERGSDLACASSRTSLAGEPAGDGVVEVERAAGDAGRRRARMTMGSPSAGASARRRQGLAMRRDRGASGRALRAARGWR